MLLFLHWIVFLHFYKTVDLFVNVCFWFLYYTFYIQLSLYVYSFFFTFTHFFFLDRVSIFCPGWRQTLGIVVFCIGFVFVWFGFVFRQWYSLDICLLQIFCENSLLILQVGLSGRYLGLKLDPSRMAWCLSLLPGNKWVSILSISVRTDCYKEAGTSFPSLFLPLLPYNACSLSSSTMSGNFLNSSPEIVACIMIIV